MWKRRSKSCSPTLISVLQLEESSKSPYFNMVSLAQDSRVELLLSGSSAAKRQDLPTISRRLCTSLPLVMWRAAHLYLRDMLSVSKFQKSVALILMTYLIFDSPRP